ncbi:Alpha-tocopherol transfer protein-like [Frankliniella fusca]|uniref:Alpha-tocopherol transfer protein-like n=1 Tax=Frankliniella fusca TaxID=407009 RepID=A0AAE1HUJ3_9NEOP|nr:Alpha-tocopherol transfer protein-like [Frankliniella fusca]
MAKMGPEIWTPATAEEEQRIYSGVETDAASVKRDALQLRQWLLDQPHLPDVPEEDLPWLERYLVCSKNSLERAKRGLDCYFTVRSEAPAIFADRDSDTSAFKRTFDYTYVVTLPKLTPALHRVHVYAYAPPDAYGGDLNDFSFEDLYRRMSMTMDVKFREDLCAGEVCVLDLQHNTAGHMAKFTAVLPFVKNFFACSLAAYPARIHQIHVINAPSYMSTIEGLIKPFLKKKIQDRVIIHPPGLDSFFEHVPKAMLPKDYGGEEKSLKELSDAWRTKIEAYRPWFLAQEGVKSDESRRVGDKTALQEEIFGCQGSFRQLTVD